MAGSCIEKLPHSCGSSDGLQVFESHGHYSGYCFVCDVYVPSPYGDAAVPAAPTKVAPSPEQIEGWLSGIDSLRAFDLGDRQLGAWALDYFGVKVGLSEQDGDTPELHYYPYTKKGARTGYKVRRIADKSMWTVGDCKAPDMFGWPQALAAGAKRLMITEGELDAVALFQALKVRNATTKWADLNPSVVSLTRGASAAKADILHHMQDIRALFKEVILVFDMDEEGQAAAQSIIQILPMARAVKLPAKDANACIMEGRSDALCKAVLFQSFVPKNTRLVWGQSLYEAGRQQAQWGLSWPWQGLTQLTRGIRFGETYYLGAGVKMGKSEVVNTLAAHLITEHGLKVFLAKPEEANRKTYQLVLGKVAGRIFHDPTIEFDYAAYDAASKAVGDSLCMLSLYQHLGWDSLRNDIIEAAAAGCKAIFIDPITNLVNGIASGETNTILQEIAQELAALAKDLDIVVFIFCHLKAAPSGDAHERGGKVYSHQFSGSRAMMRSCNLMLGLEGNKDADIDEYLQNTRRLVILEDREFGVSGYINLYWDSNTGLFNEIKETEDDDRTTKRTRVSSD